jgi:membrane complex biogenesis BtpA family protein
MFGTEKPIVAMVHLAALPGDPCYSDTGGIKSIIDGVLQDLHNLQEGGVDAVMFSNENSRPYLIKYGPETVATMARVIGEILHEIEVPYGVNVLWDPIASLALAKATGATFVREVFTGTYSSDMGVWNTSCGDFLRYRKAIDGDHIRLLYNIHPEFAKEIAGRDPAEVARTTIISSLPDIICVSGAAAGMETSTELLRQVKTAVKDFPVFVNTGVNINNVKDQLSIADGVVVASSLKIGGDTWKPVDPMRVISFMKVVKELRQELKQNEDA